MSIAGGYNIYKAGSLKVRNNSVISICFGYSNQSD